MKHEVTDEAVREYADRIRNGVPLGTLFPSKMSDCDFTNEQREIIRRARAEKKVKIKKTNNTTESTRPNLRATKPVQIIQEPKVKPLTKLRKMLYLQSDRCFFCGQILDEEDASIEHLLPLSKGGTRTEDNEVVCHKSLNETFGQMDLKAKVAFIIRQSGNITCPKTTE